MKLFACPQTRLLLTLTIAAFCRIELAAEAQSKMPEQPNILWLVQEDLSPWIGCYGYTLQEGATPNIDALASRGVRFSRAYTPAPVCSACRSGFIVGANQIRFGAHEHRSRRGAASLPLPEGMKTLPVILAEKGYFAFNVGKTDYNFEHSDNYSVIPKSQLKTPWRATPKGKPFFGQIQLKGGKLNTARFPAGKKVDRSKVTIPADYPQNDLYREIVGEHYDSVRMDDGNIGSILAQLKSDGLLDKTIVVYFSDHGANNLVRHKQQPTEAGLHVPLVIAAPDGWLPIGKDGVIGQQVRNDLVSILDVTATTLAWAGIEFPKWIEGQDLFAGDFKPNEFVGSARDRCDHTIERIRSIRTDRFRYTRNFLLDRVLLQPQYRDPRPFVVDLREAYAAGTLDPKLTEIYFGERPAEELYDIENDPAQMNNLVHDPKYREPLERHRQLLSQWLAAGDEGAGREPDIELEMNGKAKWGTGVNVEYERLREDSDGDGLSDLWEKTNDRDPHDGLLLFTFDCGGWQTEGWQAVGKLTNIAGRQGFLDFELLQGKGAITRKGLKLDGETNSTPVRIRLRSTSDLSLKLAVNGQLSGQAQVKSGKAFVEIAIPTKVEGTLKQLRLEFVAEPDSTVEIDWIRMEKSG